MLKRLLVILPAIIGIAIIGSFFVLLLGCFPKFSDLDISQPQMIVLIVAVTIGNFSLLFAISFGLDWLYKRILATPKYTEDKKDEQPQPDPDHDRHILTIFQNGTQTHSYKNVSYISTQHKDGITTIFVEYFLSNTDANPANLLRDKIESESLTVSYDFEETYP